MEEYVSVDAEVECDLLLAMDSLQGRFSNFCLAHIQRYRDTWGSRRHRRVHPFNTSTLQHINKRQLKVNPSHCSLIAVELSLCELIALLVDELLFKAANEVKSVSLSGGAGVEKEIVEDVEPDEPALVMRVRAVGPPARSCS